MAVGPASAQRPGLSVDALSCLRPSSKSLPAALPAFQRVIRCISGVKKPGRGFREAEPPEAFGPRPGAAPLKGRGLRPRLRGPATQRSGPGASLRAEGPPLAFPPLEPSCKRGPPPRPPRPGVTLRPRGLLRPGAGARRQAQAEAGDRPRASAGGRPRTGEPGTGKSREGAPRTCRELRAGAGRPCTRKPGPPRSVTRPSALRLCRAPRGHAARGRGSQASKGSALWPPQPVKSRTKGPGPCSGGFFRPREGAFALSAQRRKPPGPREACDV